MTISKRKRWRVMVRDRHTCQYCGKCAPRVELVLDHVFPRSNGHGDEEWNLVASCTSCNSGKTDAYLPQDHPVYLAAKQRLLEQHGGTSMAVILLAGIYMHYHIGGEIEPPEWAING